MLGRQFGDEPRRILETAFKKETVGLVTREQYVEKRVNSRNKIEEEEKQKLQKLQQEEEELQLQKRKKRKIKGNSQSFGLARFQNSQLGKDPTMETSFLPDNEREAEEQVECERLRKQWLLEQEQIRSNYPLQITYSYWDEAGHMQVLQFPSAFQQQLAPEFREIQTSVENLLYVKVYLIIPHPIVNKARGKTFSKHISISVVVHIHLEHDMIPNFFCQIPSKHRSIVQCNCVTMHTYS
ncbi:hypothetical protein UlMin_007959 [Ulmus minor]